MFAIVYVQGISHDTLFILEAKSDGLAKFSSVIYRNLYNKINHVSNKTKDIDLAILSRHHQTINKLFLR